MDHQCMNGSRIGSPIDQKCVRNVSSMYCSNYNVRFKNGLALVSLCRRVIKLENVTRCHSILCSSVSSSQKEDEKRKKGFQRAWPQGHFTLVSAAAMFLKLLLLLRLWQFPQKSKLGFVNDTLCSKPILQREWHEKGKAVSAVQRSLRGSIMVLVSHINAWAMVLPCGISI